jgi:hypothetical protein
VPWLLCALSLGLMVASGWLRWRFPDDSPNGDVDWLQGAIGALGFAGLSVVGAMVASRLPANPNGWLWCAAGLTYAVSDVATPLARALGWPSWAAWALGGWGFVVLLAVLVFVFLLFPTGRLPGPRWRWLAAATGTLALVLIVLVLLIPDPGDPTAVSPWGPQGEAGRILSRVANGFLYAMFGAVLLAMWALVLRFRRAGPIERRQLSWFLYATVVNGLLLVFDSALGLLPPLASAVVSAVGFALLPLAVGVAMLRYRLYEIDRIVSRTVSYGLLSAGLIALYLLAVALLRPLLEPLTGSSALAVAASTLAVAAAFNPARRRLQAVVDRRFDRARYDAGRAVEAFAARLRDQVDLDQITDGLCETVTATVAPGRVAVWLRPGLAAGRLGDLRQRPVEHLPEV